jgi:hypothetical protein
VIMDRRDHVLIGFFCPVVFNLRTFSRRWRSTNGPFLIERPMTGESSLRVT